MELFYRPKHMKKQYNFNSLFEATNFVVEETTWYGKWWIGVFKKVGHRFYQFGEYVQAGGIWVIDKIDHYLEH